jgi:hypothetical protein
MTTQKKLHIHTKFHYVKILFMFTDTQNTSFQTQQHTNITSGHIPNTPNSQKYLRSFVILSTNFGKVSVTVISITQVDFSAKSISLLVVLQHHNCKEAYSVVRFPTSLNLTPIYIYIYIYTYMQLTEHTCIYVKCLLQCFPKMQHDNITTKF